MNKIDLSIMAKKWPSAIVAREEVSKFTGGAISERTLANLDCCGDGIPDRFKIGRKICYRVESLVSWLERRATSIQE